MLWVGLTPQETADPTPLAIIVEPQIQVDPSAHITQPLLGNMRMERELPATCPAGVAGDGLVEIVEVGCVVVVHEHQDVRQAVVRVHRIELFHRLQDMARDPVERRIRSSAADDCTGRCLLQLIVETVISG